ncbi:MAG: polysaccharide biosynthesis/export family protein [bacterium]
MMCREKESTPFTEHRPPFLFSRISWILILFSFSVLGLQGCGSAAASAESADAVSAPLPELDALPAPGPAESPPPADYRLGAEDVMNIVVYGEPDLTSVSRVSREGFIELPLIGRIQAAGLTTEELKRRIEDALRAGYLVHPDVQIILQQYRQEMVHLFGQVGTPGPFRITHRDTLMEVISKAGGFTPIANRKKVKVIRKDENGSRVIIVNTVRITDDGRLEEDVPLSPGDVIIVPERFF